MKGKKITKGLFKKVNEECMRSKDAHEKELYEMIKSLGKIKFEDEQSNEIITIIQKMCIKIIRAYYW